MENHYYILISILEGSAVNTDTILRKNLQYTDRIIRTGDLIVCYYHTKKAISKDIKLLKEIAFEDNAAIMFFENTTYNLIFAHINGVKVTKEVMEKVVVDCYKLLLHASDSRFQATRDYIVRSRYNDMRSEKRRKLRAVA